MRQSSRIAILAALSLGTLCALAQTPQKIPVTGNLGSILGSPSPYASVEIELYNCPAPVSVTGYMGIVQTSSMILADASGNVNSTIWPNDLITCNGSSGQSTYGVTYIVNGVPSSSVQCYSIQSAQGQWYLNGQQTPVSCGTTPPSPTSGTFANLNSTGFFQGNNGAFSGGLTLDGALAVGSLTAGSVAGAINSVAFPTSFAQLQAAVTACGSSACTIGINTTIVPSSNYTIPSNVATQFANGAQLQPNTGVTLAVNGPVQAPPVQIFGGAGTVTLGAINSIASVEWFGAVGDWNGTTGTDNKLTLQACLNALASGQCVLLEKSYKVTGALTIGKSNVGISGVTASLRNDAIFPNPSPSQIITTSSTADVITAAGANASAQIVGNRFTNFTMSRTVAPSTMAAGIRLSYSSNAVIDYVTGQDHTACFYFFGSGSLGYGYVSNSACTWGYNGVTETSGNLAGFEINSIGGTTSPSMRLRNTFEASNLGTASGATTFGIEVDGNSVNDFHSFHNESAQTNYGIYIIQTGGSFGNSSDIFLSEPINDGCLTSCLYFSGIQGSVVVNGGWEYENAAASNGPDIDIEQSSNVTISKNQLYYPATSQPGIHANVAGSLHLVDNWIFGNQTAIDLVTTSSSVISGNVMNGPNNWGTNVISLITGSKGNVVANNSIQGTATNGIFIDTTSISVSGLDTNQIGSIASLGTITNLINDANQLGASTPESLVVGNINIPGSGGVQFPLLAGGGPECLQMDSTGHVTGTGVPCPPLTLVATLTTTAATTDNVTLTGMVTGGHCSAPAPTNASAATNVATTYISAKSTNSITVTHTATGGMTFDIACWPY